MTDPFVTQRWSAADSPKPRPALISAVALSLLLHIAWWVSGGAAAATVAGSNGTPPARQGDSSGSQMPLRSFQVAIVAGQPSTTPPELRGAQSVSTDTTDRQEDSSRQLPDRVPQESTNWADYLPRSALSQAPRPTETVLLPNAEDLGTGRWRGVLTLFIDETGLVRHVRTELEGLASAGEEALTPALEEATRQTLLGIRFTPGEVQGRSVRSRIAIEVEFVNDEAPRSVGAPSSMGGQ